ncbi:hypothetical protein [Acinetobacter pragensis]|uniref:VanZ-like domain-containing protein n=1 Tax=Acinetobacter pragensis TaxID=1806892 RepID=A0A151Y4M4_9GAMM|nr:hypothetical protein [Acinetobacter pragensis]KYQ72983.1 hypothetical protein AZH43_01405 [Acinetobacter pragensis]
MNTSILYEWRSAVLQSAHLSHDAWLIYTGLLVYLLAALIHQRQLKSNYAIWSVVIVALAVELFGARHDIFDKGYWRIGASLRDIVNMVLLPLILWLSVKYRVWKG